MVNRGISGKLGGGNSFGKIVRMRGGSEIAAALQNDPEFQEVIPVADRCAERRRQRAAQAQQGIPLTDSFLKISHKGKVDGPDGTTESATFNLEIKIHDFKERQCRWGDVMVALRQDEVLEGQLGEGAGLKTSDGDLLPKDRPLPEDLVGLDFGNEQPAEGDEPREGDLLDFVTAEEGGYTFDELAGFDRCKLEVTWRGRVRRRCSCLMVILNLALTFLR